MRRPSPLGPVVLTAVLAALAPAMAQVTVNPGALDLLPAQPSRPAARPAPARHGRTAPAHKGATPAPQATQTPQATPTPAQTAGQPGDNQVRVPPPGAPATPAQVRPNLPVAPPAIAALPPPAPVPEPRPLPPPIVTVSADAPGTASSVPGGLRITFGSDRQDLNPATEAALRDLARTLKSGTQDINVYAYASGAPEDPSTPRRLALGRALAARAVMIQEGIASVRIHPRALGATGGETAPDRVDVVAGAPGPPPAALTQ